MANYLPACVECSVMTWIRMVGVKQTKDKNVLMNKRFSEKFIITRMNRIVAQEMKRRMERKA